MKKIMLGAVAFAAIGGSAAMAADLPARAYTKAAAAIPVAVYNWTGFYVGLNGGGDWSRTRFDYFPNPAGYGPSVPAIAAAGSNRYNRSGFTGGGQVGYNWQAGAFVYGLEADVQYTDVRGSNLAIPVIGYAPTTINQTYSSNWLATFRGRVGVTSGPVLFYGTGGLAVANVSYNDLVNFTSLFNLASNSETRAGYAAGAGVEWKINSNWSVKGEYLYVDLGKTSYTSANSNPAYPLATIFHDHRLTENIGRVGVNYAFGGPVVAKY